MKNQNRMITLLLSLALSLGLMTAASAAARTAADFPDYDSWAWYAEAMAAAVEDGLLRGDDKGLLNPQDPITRAEFAQIFHNIIQDYILAPGTYTGDYDGNLLVRTDDVILQDLTVDGDLIIGCGAADGAVTLDNVTVTGRVVVWGGGADAVWMNNGTDVADLIVCRVDGPVKVIFDKDSTLKVYDAIDVTITDRAEAFEETEVIFYDVSGILDEQEKVNAALANSEISISLPAHLYATVDETGLETEIRNGSDKDSYRVELRRNDTGAAVTEAVEIAPGATLLSLWLTEPLPYGDYPCTATVTALRDGEAAGTVEIAVTIHSAYLWNL